MASFDQWVMNGWIKYFIVVFLNKLGGLRVKDGLEPLCLVFRVLKGTDVGVWKPHALPVGVLHPDTPASSLGGMYLESRQVASDEEGICSINKQ